MEKMHTAVEKMHTGEKSTLENRCIDMHHCSFEICGRCWCLVPKCNDMHHKSLWKVLMFSREQAA